MDTKDLVVIFDRILPESDLELIISNILDVDPDEIDVAISDNLQPPIRESRYLCLVDTWGGGFHMSAYVYDLVSKSDIAIDFEALLVKIGIICFARSLTCLITDFSKEDRSAGYVLCINHLGERKAGVLHEYEDEDGLPCLDFLPTA